ncbi:hypothetical protein DYB38_008412 [Aphanomyces astaci]|nr:hypothetical protein DYB38_008412 [Aphanomyces astaci]
MMAFNLKEDREEGHFDESGNFVWAKEEQPMQEDAWLENVSAQEMEGAERARILRQEARTDDEETWTERRATSVFMEVLEEGETVLKALKRLGKKKKGSKGPEQTPDMKREFDELTEATDFLMRQGKADVYHTPKEQLVPQAPPPPPVLWEYKSQDGLIQGPFPSSNFVEWQAQVPSSYEASCSSLCLELARAASSVEVMKRTMLDLPSTLLDLLLDMIDDTWQDVVGLHHYNKRGEVHYALL